MKTLLRLSSALLLLAAGTLRLTAAGLLTPVGSPGQPLQIHEHRVEVTVTDGFARVEVSQLFHNPNPEGWEALYSFPVPRGAALAEAHIHVGDTVLVGEVQPRARAEKVYEEEKAAGRSAGMLARDSYQKVEYRLSAIPAGGTARMRFVYLQPLEIDAGVGRFVYALEDGRTDTQARSFWDVQSEVAGPFSLRLELRSGAPIQDVRVPGYESIAQVSKSPEGVHVVQIEQKGVRLERDFVLYYRLMPDTPARVEVIPYRASPDRPGTFMMVMTPGDDLQPLPKGADYIYVLDVSGSMQTKLPRLIEGVNQALGLMKPEDRFRVVTFNKTAREVVGWSHATPQNVQRALDAVRGLQAEGSTHLYAGLRESIRGLDTDRTTSLVLVTDGVANEGVVDPRSFRQLLEKHDLRIFGFLVGNGSNWPLLRIITEASGGYYAAVSNDDDIVGQILLAKTKIGSEALHDAKVTVTGAFGLTGNTPRKIYRGQQLVVFGRFSEAGRAEVTLQARVAGEVKTYRTSFEFPAQATDHPELERLWALAQIEELEQKRDIGALDSTEAEQAITDLAVQFQVVTEQTAMVLLDEETFARRGEERLNQARTEREHAAQARRLATAPVSYRVDSAQPAFASPAVHVSRTPRGGGAIELDAVGVALLFLVLVGLALSQADKARRKKDKKDS